MLIIKLVIMKLKIFKGVFAALIVATVATWNLRLSSKTEKLFDLTLANIEALAKIEDPEGSKPCSNYVTKAWAYYCPGGNSYLQTFVSWICQDWGPGNCSIGWELADYDCDTGSSNTQSSVTDMSDTCRF
jgi:hypothetical protein